MKVYLASLLTLGVLTMGSMAPVAQAAKPDKKNITLPVVSAIDFYLGKVGKTIYLPKATKISSTDANKVALNLGVVSTDSIIAIHNKDKTQFQYYSRLIYEYAERLNVQKNILATYPKIKRALDNNEFKSLERLTKLMREQILREMNKSYRKDQAALAYVAGWIEGLYLMTATIESSYAAEKTAILDRDVLLKQLIDRMNHLHPKIQNRSDVKQIRAALPKLQKIMQKKSYALKDVVALKKICYELRQKILS